MWYCGGSLQEVIPDTSTIDCQTKQKLDVVNVGLCVGSGKNLLWNASLLRATSLSVPLFQGCSRRKRQGGEKVNAHNNNTSNNNNNIFNNKYNTEGLIWRPSTFVLLALGISVPASDYSFNFSAFHSAANSSDMYSTLPSLPPPPFQERKQQLDTHGAKTRSSSLPIWILPELPQIFLYTRRRLVCYSESCRLYIDCAKIICKSCYWYLARTF